MQQKENTNYTFKFLYAIGMIIIVAGHCNNGGISLFFNWFTPYSFHLALFVFTSGYFYKSKNEENIKNYIIKKIKKLIIPMYIWNIIYAIFSNLIKFKGFSMGENINIYNILIKPIINGHQFVFTLGLWFVVPLFMIEVINILFMKALKYKKNNVNEYILFVISLILGMLGIYMSKKGLNNGWYLVITRVLYLIPFYYLGILYKNKLEKKDKLNNIIYFSIIFLIQLIIITKYEKIISYTPSWCNNFSDGLLTPFIVAILGIAFWLRVAKIIEPLIYKSKIINCIANNTYSIMVHQLFAFFIVNTVYAILSKFILLFNEFNWIKYKSDIWYTFVPKELDQWRIIYLIAGITIPILINRIQNKLLKEINILFKKYKIKLSKKILIKGD